MRHSYVLFLGIVLFILGLWVAVRQTMLGAISWTGSNNVGSAPGKSKMAAIHIFTSPISRTRWTRLPDAAVTLDVLMSAFATYGNSLQTPETEDLGVILQKEGFPWIAELAAINVDPVHLQGSAEELAFAAECRKFGNLLERHEDGSVFEALADYAEQANHNQLALLLAR